MKYRKKPILINCIFCGNEFRIRPSKLGKAKFCSQECFGKNNRGKPGSHTGIKHSLESKEKMRIAKLNNPTRYWADHEFTLEHRKNMSLANIGRKPPKTAYKKGQLPWNAGKELLEVRGENSPSWKGGKGKQNMGYITINIDTKRRLEHRFIMEEYLGRPLDKKEVVHHINGDKTDNRIENLQLLPSQSEHMKIHLKERWATR